MGPFFFFLLPLDIIRLVREKQIDFKILKYGLLRGFSLPTYTEREISTSFMDIDCVRITESLLLGSLLWFVGIICQPILLLVPWLIAEPEVVPMENMERKGLRRVALEGAGNKILDYFVLQSLVNSRRSRASRTKMKMNFLVF